MKKIIIYILFVTGFGSIYGQAVKIDIHIPNLKNQDIILGHNFNDQLLPDDTITLNNKGVGTFLRKEQYPGGMYFLFLPNSRKFDFLLDKDQQFSMYADTSDYLKTVTFKGSEENMIFLEFQKTMESRAIKMKKLTDARIAAKGNKQKVREIDSILNELNKLKRADFDKVINTNPDLFLSKFLKATMQVEIPKTIKGRQAQYYYFRNHYFDNFDISDPRLLRTPIYMSTIDRYLDKLLMQHPDTLIPEVDMLIEKSKTNEELLRFMLVHLFNKYSSSQIITSENVMVHIAEKYYATDLNTWSDPKFIKELKAKLRKKKNCLIGNVAKDIDFRILNVDTFEINKLVLENKKLNEGGLKIEKSDADSIVKHNMKVELIKEFFFEFEETGSLFTTDAEYTIIWFWTPDCSHCRKDTPKFYEMYMKKKLYEKNVRVISMFMQKDIADWKKFAEINEDWLKFINEHDMSKWIHAWNPFDTFRRNFDIESSPVIYLLDKNKEIIAKKIAYKQAIEIIEIEMKKKTEIIKLLRKDNTLIRQGENKGGYPWGHSGPYNDFSTFFKKMFNTRVQKIAVNAGFTCPNRDGSKGYGGCTYCNNDTFNPFYCDPRSPIEDQLIEGINFFSEKYKTQKYLAYFQAYSNTYSNINTLKRLYSEALSVEGVIGLVIATRPDCISEELLDYLHKLAENYYIGLEYGIETCSNDTLKAINRGHTFEETVAALQLSNDRNLHVGVHYIIGLPGDEREDNLDHASILSELPFETLKLHQLQIIKGTKMAKQFYENPDMFNLFSADEYIDFSVSFAERLNPKIIIERFISESPSDLLIAPKWGGLKNFEIVSKINKKFLERESFQGILYKSY